MSDGARQESRVARVARAAYQDLIVKEKTEITFWVLITFLPTFVITRALVFLMPQLFVNVGGTHVHHLTWGIILLAITGWLGLVVESPRWRPRIAALYGIGLALAFDEFGMWLRLQDGYWVRQSYDAILVITALLLGTVYLFPFWVRILHRLLHPKHDYPVEHR